MTEQMDQKPPGSLASQFEEEDGFFDDGDTDSDPDYDEVRVVEDGSSREESLLYNEEEQGKKCGKVHLCHYNQHVTEFIGYPLFELFKVKLIFNPNPGSTNKPPFKGGKLYGEIATVKSWMDPANPKPITYYRVTPEKPDLINLDPNNNNKYSTLLPISGADPRPPFCDNYSFDINFALKINDKDILTRGYPYVNRGLFGPRIVKSGRYYSDPHTRDMSRDGTGPYISRLVFGDPSCDRILLVAHYSKYYGAWAAIDVKMLKDGVGSFYGLIVARPCIFSSRIRLLTIRREKDKNVVIERDAEKGVVASDGCIKLTRSVVAIPNYSSLIIGAKLYYEREDGRESLICRGKTAFFAKRSGVETNCISYNGVETLQVTVNWNRKREVSG